MNPDRLAELEDERRFLLRSLRDLDAELAAGDVDAPDYETLRDGYTKRAADVLREIEEGKAALPPRRPTRWGRRAVIAAVVVAVALGAGWLVARSSGQRLGGDGGTEAGGPDDLGVVLAQARALIAVDPARAQSLYAQVLEETAGPPRGAGLLRVPAVQRVGRCQRRAAREQRSRPPRDQLARAVEVDPQYADPHCFLAVIATDAGDSEAAGIERDRCFALDPPAQLRTLVDETVAGR